MELERYNSYVTASADMNEAIPDMNEAIPDLNEAIQDLNEFPDLNQEPQSCYIHPLMDEISLVFHPYVSHIQNVEGDGQCGFQAIYVCVGYGEDQWLYVLKQLVDEL